MANNSLKNEEELNLIELILKIWEGKWKILTIIIISIIFMIINIYLSTQNKNYFTASTDVQPISTFQENDYIAFNNLVSYVTQNQDLDAIERSTIEKNLNYFSEFEFYKLSKSNLFKVYIELLNNKKIFEDGIREYNLLNVNKYINEQQYDSAIIDFASSIKILLNKTDNKVGFENIGAQIQFTYSDPEKWKRVLIYVDEQANTLIRQNLIKYFNTLLSTALTQRDHMLEDVDTEINNIIIDYEDVITTQLLYLEEHLQLAKTLGLAKNTMEMVPNFNSVSSSSNPRHLLDVIKPGSAYYLRGYEAIEKEIELIKNRENIKPFIPELLRLERAKRAIKQDKTLARIKSHLLTTPLYSDQSFKAASINTLATKFTYKKEQHKKKVVLAGVIGLILGIFFVIIVNALKSVKSYRSK